MGRAIVRNPKVFLMDEPLSNLDAKLRVQMRAEIASLHQRLGATIIYVTHDQTEAMTLGTRIVVLKDGVIQQVDTPKRLYNEPQNLFVAGFIGSPQMNFIDAVSYTHLKGKRLRLYYITQVAVKPPTFVIFVNDKQLMHFSYTRYIENRIRDAFGFRGTSLKFIIRERKEG